MTDHLLAGVKVADFTWVATGPLMTRTLADYGAEVVKIEGRSSPDSMRVSGPFKDGVPGLEREGWFLIYNTNKMSVGLNLTNPKGTEVAKRFVAWADIVAENFAGGVMEKMGLGYEELKKVKPDIIMISASMQGQTGPHARHRALGGQLAALSGFCHITGWPEGEPLPIGVYTDYIVPHFSVPVLLAALLHRRRTGKGQYIDLSQYEAGLQFMAPVLLDYAVNHREANRMGNRSDHATLHGAYRCQGEDSWCAISVFTEEEWRSFCQVIGNPEWSNRPEFGTLLARKQHEDRPRPADWRVDDQLPGRTGDDDDAGEWNSGRRPRNRPATAGTGPPVEAPRVLRRTRPSGGRQAPGAPGGLHTVEVTQHNDPRAAARRA